MERNVDKKESALLYVVLAVFMLVAGVVAILEPNLRGHRSSTDLFTFGRVGGWWMVNLGMGVLCKEYKRCQALRKALYRENEPVDVFILVSCLLAFSSGLVSFITGYSYGVERAVHIHDPFMRAMEGVYTVLSVILFIYYRKNKGTLRRTFADLKKNK